MNDGINYFSSLGITYCGVGFAVPELCVFKFSVIRFLPVVTNRVNLFSSSRHKSS